ncbi:MAG: hypothetical protein JXM73_12930 [Anaerolineae bacterium]|nr:hypothetical protein [Anaerolineae bacterium]
MKHKQIASLFSLTLILAISLVVIPAGARAVPSAPVTNITVNNNGDLPDATGGSGVCETVPGNGQCTLRAAIQTAEYAAGADVITVQDSIVVIAPNTDLPWLALGNVTIVGNGVYLSGVYVGSGVSGFEISSNNNKIQGFNIFGFPLHGVYIYGGDNNVVGVDGDGTGDATEGNVIFSNTAAGVKVYGSNNRISGNYIGTSDGSSTAPNRWGVYIDTGTGNLVGTDGDGVSDTLERNVISGNGDYGIEIHTDSNTVAGNYIGVNAAGSAAMGNDYGVWIVAGASYNLIGTDGDGSGDAGERNVISGNVHGGVQITGAGADYNRVAGNYIGVDQGGSAAIGNSTGVGVSGGAKHNIVGANLDGQGDTAERNVISGASWVGVSLSGEGTQYNKVAGNYIGVAATGSSALANRFGARISAGASGNTVGGVTAAARNVIAGNEQSGIWLEDSGIDNLIAGNLIGTDKTGLVAIPNGERGIFIDNSAGAIVGGTAAGARNVISGNSGSGVGITGSGSSQNTVQANYIGVGLDGTTPLANGANGVYVYTGAHHNTIGGVAKRFTGGPAGPAPEGGNVIANNGLYGVWVEGSVGNAIRGNAVYDNADLGIYSDADVGVPVLTRAVALDDPQILSVSGVLTSTPNVDHELDFFVSEQCDPSGEGEGQNYVGSALLFGTPTGRMPFLSMNFPGSYTPGHFVTATATDQDGTSSQFSWCIAIVPKKYRVYLPLAGKGLVP